MFHDERPRLRQPLMPDVVRRADRRPRVAGGGLDVDLLERRLGEDPAVGDSVERHSAGEADPRHVRLLPERAHQVEVRLLEHRLLRRGDVLVVFRHLAAGLAGRAERLHHPLGEDPTDRRRLVVPGHVDALAVVGEVVQPELEQRPVELDEPAHLVEVHRLAVRSEAHDLSLVAVVREAEPLRDRRVEDPERVREENPVEHLELVVAPVREHRAREVSEAIDRHHRGLVVRRDEERARDVGLVVLDVVELRAQRPGLDVQGVREDGPDVAHPRRVLESRFQVARRRRPPDRSQQLLREVRARVAADRYMVELGRRNTALREAPRCRERREACSVFHAVEAFFLRGRDELAVDHERSRRVAVVRIQTQDRDHDGRS
jgi:hypothetical protein